MDRQFLYISFGDGGGAGDPDENGQDLNTLLGTIVRDIDNTESNLNYGIPEDNPFLGYDARPEIYAFGLRNTDFLGMKLLEKLWELMLDNIHMKK